MNKKTLKRIAKRNSLAENINQRDGKTNCACISSDMLMNHITRLVPTKIGMRLLLIL